MTHEQIILEEMCKRTGTKYTDIDFRKPKWFWNFAWTKKEKKDFRNWIAAYLRENKEARTELMNHPSLLYCNKVADEFIMQYGWKVKE